jgi:hypothetical protein
VSVVSCQEEIEELRCSVRRAEFPRLTVNGERLEQDPLKTEYEFEFEDEHDLGTRRIRENEL